MRTSRLDRLAAVAKREQIERFSGSSSRRKDRVGSRERFGEFIQPRVPGCFYLCYRQGAFYLLAKPSTPVDHIERQLIEDIFVRWLLPLEAVGPDAANCANDRDRGDHGPERIAIDNVELYSTA